MKNAKSRRRRMPLISRIVDKSWYDKDGLFPNHGYPLWKQRNEKWTPEKNQPKEMGGKWALSINSIPGYPPWSSVPDGSSRSYQVIPFSIKLFLCKRDLETTTVGGSAILRHAIPILVIALLIPVEWMKRSWRTFNTINDRRHSIFDNLWVIVFA